MHVIGLILMCMFYDIAATWLIEVQGAVVTRSAYKTVVPLGQIVRRSINTITAITGPLLFGIMPRAPYIVAGGLTLTWTLPGRGVSREAPGRHAQLAEGEAARGALQGGHGDEVSIAQPADTQTKAYTIGVRRIL